MLTGGIVLNDIKEKRFLSSDDHLELPWDQPSYQNPEYKRWLDRDYYHNPWKKIDNMILSKMKNHSRDR